MAPSKQAAALAIKKCYGKVKGAFRRKSKTHGTRNNVADQINAVDPNRVVDWIGNVPDPLAQTPADGQASYTDDPSPMHIPIGWKVSMASINQLERMESGESPPQPDTPPHHPAPPPPAPPQNPPQSPPPQSEVQGDGQEWVFEPLFPSSGLDHYRLHVREPDHCKDPDTGEEIWNCPMRQKELEEARRRMAE